MSKWDKGELTKLYIEDGMTLEEIGSLKGVSRERVRQVMEGYGIKREHLDKPKTCQACRGLGYVEFEHGLIRLPCKACNATSPV
jgi:DnaJ-class molecular chaperone